MTSVHPSRRTGGASVLAVALALLGGACSDDSSRSSDTAPATLPRVCASEQPELRVDRIDAAVEAVEAQRGGPQRFYEINATPLLVNLFVAGEAPGEVVPYAYVGEELTSGAPLSGASGSTFTADAIDVDPLRATSCVRAQLPQSSLEVFEVLGGSQGSVQYSILVTSPNGGQLIVVVDRAGAVLSVDPVDAGTPVTGTDTGTGTGTGESSTTAQPTTTVG